MPNHTYNENGKHNIIRSRLSRAFAFKILHNIIYYTGNDFTTHSNKIWYNIVHGNITIIYIHTIYSNIIVLTYYFNVLYVLM